MAKSNLKAAQAAALQLQKAVAQASKKSAVKEMAQEMEEMMRKRQAMKKAKEWDHPWSDPSDWTGAKLATLKEEELKARLSGLVRLMKKIEHDATIGWDTKSRRRDILRRRFDATLIAWDAKGMGVDKALASLDDEMLKHFANSQPRIKAWIKKGWIRWGTLKRLNVYLDLGLNESGVELKGEGSLSKDLARAMTAHLSQKGSMLRVIKIMAQVAKKEGWNPQKALEAARAAVDKRAALEPRKLAKLLPVGLEALKSAGLAEGSAAMEEFRAWAAQKAKSKDQVKASLMWGRAIDHALELDDEPVVMALMEAARKAMGEKKPILEVEARRAWWEKASGKTKKIDPIARAMEHKAPKSAAALLDQKEALGLWDQAEEKEALKACARSVDASRKMEGLLARCARMVAQAEKEAGSPVEKARQIAREELARATEAALPMKRRAGAKKTAGRAGASSGSVDRKVAALEAESMRAEVSLSGWGKEPSVSQQEAAPKRKAARL